MWSKLFTVLLAGAALMGVALAFGGFGVGPMAGLMGGPRNATLTQDQFEMMHDLQTGDFGAAKQLAMQNGGKGWLAGADDTLLSLQSQMHQAIADNDYDQAVQLQTQIRERMQTLRAQNADSGSIRMGRGRFGHAFGGCPMADADDQ